MTPVPASNATPAAAIARVGVDFDPVGPAASVDEPGKGDPLDVADPVGDGDTEGDPDPLGDVPGLGDPVGLDLRNTITRPHTPQFGKAWSEPFTPS